MTAAAYSPGVRQRNAEPLGFGGEETMRHLDQHAGAVADQRIGADRAAVGQVLHDLEFPLSMMRWDFSLRRLTTKPTPQASCSRIGS